jgi:transposase
VSKVVSRLDEKGLAERQHADGNARDQRLVLTAAGRKLLPQLAALADANDEHFFGHLDTAERRAPLKAMQGLVRHQAQESSSRLTRQARPSHPSTQGTLMNESARAVIEATFQASNQGSIHFGEVIARLVAAGVESYHVDYRAGRSVYYLPDDTTLT